MFKFSTIMGQINILLWTHIRCKGYGNPFNTKKRFPWAIKRNCPFTFLCIPNKVQKVMTLPFLRQRPPPPPFQVYSPLSSKKCHTPTPKWLNFWKVLPPPLIRGRGAFQLCRIYSLGLCLMQNRLEMHVLLGEGSGKIWTCSF